MTHEVYSAWKVNKLEFQNSRAHYFLKSDMLVFSAQAELLLKHAT